MNILDTEETKFNIVIEVFILISFTRCSIRHGIDLRTKGLI